jgi:hypothetical protein
LRLAVAEVRGQFRILEEQECPLFEAVARRLMKIQETEETEVCAVVNCKMCVLVKRLHLLVITICKNRGWTLKMSRMRKKNWRKKEQE